MQTIFSNILSDCILAFNLFDNVLSDSWADRGVMSICFLAIALMTYLLYRLYKSDRAKASESPLLLSGLVVFLLLVPGVQEVDGLVRDTVGFLRVDICLTLFLVFALYFRSGINVRGKKQLWTGLIVTWLLGSTLAFIYLPSLWEIVYVLGTVASIGTFMYLRLSNCYRRKGGASLFRDIGVYFLAVSVMGMFPVMVFEVAARKSWFSGFLMDVGILGSVLMVIFLVMYVAEKTKATSTRSAYKKLAWVSMFQCRKHKDYKEHWSRSGIKADHDMIREFASYLELPYLYLYPDDLVENVMFYSPLKQEDVQRFLEDKGISSSDLGDLSSKTIGEIFTRIHK